MASEPKKRAWGGVLVEAAKQLNKRERGSKQCSQQERERERGRTNKKNDGNCCDGVLVKQKKEDGWKECESHTKLHAIRFHGVLMLLAVSDL